MCVLNTAAKLDTWNLYTPTTICYRDIFFVPCFALPCIASKLVFCPRLSSLSSTEFSSLPVHIEVLMVNLVFGFLLAIVCLNETPHFYSSQSVCERESHREEVNRRGTYTGWYLIFNVFFFGGKTWTILFIQINAFFRSLIFSFVFGNKTATTTCMRFVLVCKFWGRVMCFFSILSQFEIFGFSK